LTTKCRNFDKKYRNFDKEMQEFLKLKCRHYDTNNEMPPFSNLKGQSFETIIQKKTIPLPAF
jgi:hypothetical protein